MLVTSVNSIASGPACFNVFSQQDIRFTKMDKKVTDNQVTFFKQVVEDVNGSLGHTNLVIPDHVEIKIYTEHPSPVANPIDMSVNAGVRLFVKIPTDRSNPQSMKSYYKAPSFSGPILAHEYGHIVFSENYGLREPVWREAFKVFRAKLPELTQKNQQYNDTLVEIDRVQKLLESTKDPAQIAQLKGEVLKLTMITLRINQEIQKEGALISALSTIARPYNEFFADVMAVLYTGKASSIEDAVTFTHALQGKGKVPELSKESNNARDFKDGVRNGTHKDNFEDHGYFSTVRVNVWESYLASPTYRTAKRGQVTEAIFEAIAKECSALIHGGAPVSFHGKEKWLEMNERLMKAIDTEMAARGITKLK